MAEKIINPFIDVKAKQIARPNLLTLTPNAQSQNFFGTLFVGNNKVKIDGQNGRIVIRDETGLARIVIGNI